MLLLLVAAIGGCANRQEYDQRGGRNIADAIEGAGSPIVETVNYHPGDLVDAATIEITVRDGSKPAEISTLMCNVVARAVQRGNPPDSLGILVWDHAVTRVLADESLPCPS